MKTTKYNFWGIFWAVVGLLYFFIPLYGTLEFSLRMIKGRLSFEAYRIILEDPKFLESFRYSAIMGLITVLISVMIFLPTVYWIHLRLPSVRPIIEVITILPFIIPVIVYVFGIIRTFSRPPLQMTLHPFTTDILMVAGYVVLSMPYMYRALDVGMRSIDVRTLTEAAQSLGSNWLQILLNVIIPNLRIAILSGSLICFATVIGELILGDFLVRPALGPYMVLIGRDRAYEPAALAILSYGLTWLCLGLIQAVSRGGTSQQLTGR
ncbi:ABC transporter permease [Leptolinea tardivitalis]|uniref:Spermidine/putrescine ABC transporter permease n=1 Tax=Leptolinea tardivitalis TaxID=229920 RepID=A0A0P6WVC8_9CHLR|nr:ABC transporter permease subunit [Leptolinea tardivitalis]KPL70541.1 spermidine/putrescine ABC transporter permease [Leptolinea tardivitalis]GAP22144.1 ABC-type spermidine/putrescine transport system, permease component II [Leptolinea tardivitalis]